MSSQHPNKQHVVLLWNVWSNKCGSIAEAYAAMKRLLTRVSSNRLYSFTADWPPSKNTANFSPRTMASCHAATTPSSPRF